MPPRIYTVILCIFVGGLSYAGEAAHLFRTSYARGSFARGGIERSKYKKQKKKEKF